MPRERLPAARGFPTADEIRANPNPVRVPTGKVKIGKAARKQQRVLSLDMSSSCIGWAFGENPEIIAYGKLVFTDDREMGECLSALRSYLTALLTTYRPDRVICEKPLGRKANTTSLHNQILGVVRLIVYEVMGYEVLDTHLIPPRTVKNTLNVPSGDSHAMNKQIMVNHVNNACGLDLRYAGTSLRSDDDTADAIALLLTIWTPRKAA